MKRTWWILFLAAAAVLVYAVAARRARPVEIPFAKARRERLVSALTTNGKVEPLKSVSIRAERDGLIRTLNAANGRTIARGQILAEMSQAEASAEASTAESRLAAAQADLTHIERGGKQQDLADVDGSIARNEADRKKLSADLAAARRLVEKNAAPASEVTDLEQRLARVDVEAGVLARQRKALTADTDESVARARIAEARAALTLAQSRRAMSVIRAPQAGTIYNLTARPGTFVRAGDLIAEVGRLDRLKVIVYVDEPELGRLRPGLPVKITWDAMPEASWAGMVDQLPVSVTALGSRQVGEVVTVVESPKSDLPAGANVNAEIETQVVANAVTIPKEALRRDTAGFGVYVLSGGRLVWRKINVGATSTTRAQILGGVEDGEAVALPSEVDVKEGLEVTPVFP